MQQDNPNKAFILSYFNALSGHPKPKELLDKYMSDEALVAHINLFESAFPSYEVAADGMTAEGNHVFVQGLMKGTHLGNLGNIPATFKAVEVPFAIRYEIENEKIVSHWIIADQMSLMQQLGVIPAAEATH